MLFKISFFVLTFFCFFSCFQSEKTPDFSSQEKLQFEDLFKNLILAETGVYTLFGKKAMTVISLDLFSDDTGDPSDEGLYNIEMQYSLKESWDLWQKRSRKLPIANFLFFTRKTDGFEEGYDGFFVNLKTAKVVIQNNYALFKNEIGFDFDPDQVISELGDGNSKFWNHVFAIESHISKGLLFGVEKENAMSFAALDRDQIAGHMSDDLLPYEEISIENFNIPFFRSFEEKDPMIEMYKQERIRIQEYFQEHSFFDGVIKKLLE